MFFWFRDFFSPFRVICLAKPSNWCGIRNYKSILSVRLLLGLSVQRFTCNHGRTLARAILFRFFTHTRVYSARHPAARSVTRSKINGFLTKITKFPRVTGTIPFWHGTNPSTSVAFYRKPIRALPLSFGRGSGSFGYLVTVRRGEMETEGEKKSFVRV